MSKSLVEVRSRVQKRRAALFAATAATVLVSLGCGQARAQTELVTAPPVGVAQGTNGTLLTGGQFTLTTTDVSIGPADNGLAFTRSFLGNGYIDNTRATISDDGAGNYIVSIGNSSEIFTLSGTTFTSVQGLGSTLTMSTSGGVTTYTYTNSSGAVTTFSSTYATTVGVNANDGMATTTIYPDGRNYTYTYATASLCTPSPPTTPASSCLAVRVQAYNNNFGYGLKLEYASDTAPTLSTVATWQTLTKVTGINNAVENCQPTLTHCTGLTVAWPNVSYATTSAGGSNNYLTVTDTAGRATRYTFDGTGEMIAIRRPTSTGSDSISIAYSGGKISTITTGGANYTYVYSTSGGNPEVTIRDPLWSNSNAVAHTRSAVSDSTTGQLIQTIDGLGNATSYGYDSYGRLNRVTQPEGNYVSLTLDDRGNVTGTTTVGKSGATISTSASYPTSPCTGPACNKPIWTKDALGNETDYTYDPTHGGVLTVKLPSANGTSPRPQTNYTYASMYAYHINNLGATVQAIAPIYRLTGVIQCADGGDPTLCTAADQTLTTLTYPTAGTLNNLRPKSATVASGAGSVSATTGYTYDSFDNLLTVDGPLAGAGDTTRYRYDADNELVGIVSPDPLGGTQLRAQRISYNSDGQKISVERGTVPSQSDTDWASHFSNPSLELHTIVYDSAGRAIQETLQDPGLGTTLAVTQYGWDAASNLQCTAIRMNSSNLASPPSNACVLGTAGTDGEDRLTFNSYDANNRVYQVTAGLGTDNARYVQTNGYTTNGLLASLIGTNGEKTSYAYDQFDRLAYTYYPDPNNFGLSSSTDYELYGYDAASNMVSDQRRGSSIPITLNYDHLNRLIQGLRGETYGYDSLNRLTSVALAGATTDAFAYDPLGRKTSETGAMGTINYQYDAAGRRTQMTWPGSPGLTVTYNWDLANEVTTVVNTTATPSVTLATYGYDPLGRRTSLSRGNGAVTSYVYDAADRLTSLSHDLSGTTADLTQTFTYNAASQMKSLTGTNAAYTIPTPAVASTSYTADGQNKLGSVGATTIAYDGRGNLSSDGTNSYGYDVENNLTSASGNTLAYDPAGRLTKTVGSLTTQFAYDGLDLIAEYDGSGNLLRRYVHGPGTDEPLVWYEGSGTSPTAKWFVADHLGSVVALTDSTGASTNTIAYDEYGKPTSSNISRFQFTGQMWVPESGLLHYKSRAYSPSYGRFMQPDPIGYGDGLNFYTYVRSDPINKIDPLGRSTLVCTTYTVWNKTDGHLEYVRSWTECASIPSSGGAPNGGGPGGPPVTVSGGSPVPTIPRAQPRPPAPPNIGFCSQLQIGGTAVFVAGGVLILAGTAEDATVVALPLGIPTQAAGVVGSAAGSVIAGVGFIGEKLGVCH